MGCGRFQRDGSESSEEGDSDGCQITTNDVNFVDSMDLESVRIRCLDQGWEVYLVALEAAATSGTPRGPVLLLLGLAIAPPISLA